MSECKQATVGDYVTLQRGTTYKSKLLDQPGPVLLGLASIQSNGGFRSDSLKTYGGESPEKLILKPGDLYVSLKDVTQSANVLGAISRVPPKIHRGRLTQDTVKLVFKDNKLPSNYLYWLLRTPQYRHYCWERAIGTTNLSLSREDFLSFPVPELTTQRLLLVKLLEALDDKIELNREMNQTLEAIAQAIFKSWFVDFDPVLAKMEGKQPAGMDAATADLFPDEFEESPLGMIPKGWQFVPIKDMVEGVFDGPHATPPLSPTGAVFLGIKNFTGTSLDISDIRRISDEDWPRWTRRVTPQQGDIVFTYEATLGYFALIPGWLRCCLGRRIALVRPKPNEKDGLFLFHTFIATPFQELLVARTNLGSTVDRILLSEFPSYTILRPSKVLRHRFNMLVFPYWELIHNNQQQNQDLGALRNILLPKLMSGEIQVKEAEKLLETVL